jgi:tight adherence protein C
MLLVLAALAFGRAVYLVAQASTQPARRRKELLQRAASYGASPAQAAAVPGRPAPRRRRVGALALLGAPVRTLVPRKTRVVLDKRLLNAGLAKRISSDEFLGAKGLAGGSGLVLGLLVGSSLNALSGFAFAVCFGLGGFLLPDMFVNSKIAERREQIQAALPDALDLLAVSVEAGLGFDAALSKLAAYMKGPLIEELALTLNEMRLGESRSEALRRLAGRVDVPELGSFVRAIVQADQLGSSMANILRVQATDARLRRQLSAEERAMKAPLKMLAPTMVFIFPALFVVILGPTLINWTLIRGR